nr:hypothetical protein [Candidatus Sigynarchaeum springense]
MRAVLGVQASLEAGGGRLLASVIREAMENVQGSYKAILEGLPR